MQINLIDDSSVSAAPAGFTAAVAAAAQFLDNLITSPITVNILVGWGEDDNGTYPISGNTASLGGAVAGIGATYSQLRSDLIASASTATDEFAVASLPTSDPTNGASFFVSNAIAQALGILPADDSATEGAIGFNSNLSWNFSTSGQAVPGEISLVDDAELELTHALGMELGDATDDTAMMLFRYSAPGVRQLTVNGFLTPPAYFSIDGGNTDLDNYDTSSDSTLWDPATTGNDTLANPYDSVFSLTDATELNVLGFDVNTSVLEENGVIHGTSGNETIYASELPSGATFDGGATGHNIVIFDGSSSQYTIISSGYLNFTVSDTKAHFYTFTDVEVVQFTDATLNLEPRVPTDFTGSNISDVLFRNDAGGDTGFYTVGTGVNASWVDVGASSTAYSLVGAGYFLGNVTDDILYRDDATGDTGYYQISNGANVGWHDVGASSTAYSVVALGDFTGSGTDDILYRDNATGDTGFYKIVNGVNAGWVDVGASSTAYTVVGVGDFTESGTDDILYRNNATGDTGFYEIANGVNTGWHDFCASSTAYSVVALGDFSDSGTDDILYRDNASGDTGYYKIVNGVNAGWVDVGASSTAYSVVGVGGFIGSGTNDFTVGEADDILYRNNDTGDTGFYEIVNGVNAGWHDIGASSTAYSVVGVGDFMGNGTADILYRDNSTGDTGFYEIVNGANVGWHDIGASSTAYSVVGTGDYLGDGTNDILFRNNSTGDTGFYELVNGVNTGWHDIGATSTAYHVAG